MTTPATVHGFVNGFFLGHLWDIILWLWSSGNITSCRQVAQHGWVGGMWRGKLRENRHDHISCFGHMAHSCRFFAEAPLEGAHIAPCQLLVHSLIGSGQLLPRFRGRQTTKPGMESSIYMTFFFKSEFNPVSLKQCGSYLPIKSLHFGEHPETTPYRSTYSTAHTALPPHRSPRDRCLR